MVAPSSMFRCTAPNVGFLPNRKRVADCVKVLQSCSAGGSRFSWLIDGQHLFLFPSGGKNVLKLNSMPNLLGTQQDVPELHDAARSGRCSSNPSMFC
jgi:hypothetical protein